MGFYISQGQNSEICINNMGVLVSSRKCMYGPNPTFDYL